MSYLNYVEALERAKKCEFYYTQGGMELEVIESAEEKIGFSFSNQCRDFYLKYGYISFSGNEIFGIDPDDDSGILEGNSIAYALYDRDKYNLPRKWLPVYNFGDGNLAYLDYSELNLEKEPRVIMACYDGKKYVVEGVIAEDFGQFLLRLINNEL